jgi:multidrug efflux system membrane fusion protein
MQLSKRALWTVAFGVVLLAAATFLLMRLLPGSRAAQPKSAPSVPVTAAAVSLKEVAFRLYAIGNVEPYTSVAVKARVDGQIVGVRFKEGDLIHKGAILFEIDPRPFVASLDQAKANRAKDTAQLERAKTQDTRYQDLLAQKFISQDAYEQVKATLKTTEAAVRADDAAIETAQLQLEFATIRAPIDGYAGRIMIQQGNLVKANDANPLVTLNQIVPVYSSFAVPEQNLAQIRQHQSAGDLIVQATLPNTTHPPVTGRLSFIDNAADMTTGTIKLKAEFPNNDTALWPGQFVNVVLTLYRQKDAIVVPSVAVQNGPNGSYVFVVKSDQTVELRNIKVARNEGDDAVVASGLSAGEQVVTVGQLRLAPGSKVTIGGGQAS